MKTINLQESLLESPNGVAAFGRVIAKFFESNNPNKTYAHLNHLLVWWSTLEEDSSNMVEFIKAAKNLTINYKKKNKKNKIELYKNKLVML